MIFALNTALMAAFLFQSKLFNLINGGFMKRFLVFVILILFVLFWWIGCEKTTPVDSVNDNFQKLDKPEPNPELFASTNYFGELYPALAPSSFHQEAHQYFPFIKWDASAGVWYCDNGDPSCSDLALVDCDDFYGANNYGSAFDMAQRPNETPVTLGYPSGGSTVTLSGSGEGIPSEMLPPTYANLNPSYESWTASEAARPLAWQVSELSGTGYDQPSSWSTVYYFPTLTQNSSNVYDGVYSTQIPVNSLQRSKVFASGYFLIPTSSQASGLHSMTIHVKGNVATGNAVYFAGAFFNALGTLLYEQSDYIPAGNYTNWQPITLSYTAPQTVAYVRFAIKTASRITVVTTLDVDLVQLRNSIGDVSLPVTLLSFEGDTKNYDYYYDQGNPYSYSDDLLRAIWECGSEINNNYFLLYYQNQAGNWVQASTEQVQGAGSVPWTTYYENEFTLMSGPAYDIKNLPQGTPVKFCLASVDFDETVYIYNEDDPVNIVFVRAR